MATVTGLTAARMLAIEAASIVSARLEAFSLILTKQNGVDINLGNIRGAAGATGLTGPTGPPGADGLNSIPSGFIQAFAPASSTPDGWLECNGQSVAQATYPNLYNALVTLVPGGPVTANTSGPLTFNFNTTAYPWLTVGMSFYMVANTGNITLSGGGIVAGFTPLYITSITSTSITAALTRGGTAPTVTAAPSLYAIYLAPHTGVGGSNTQFRLPDLRERVLRHPSGTLGDLENVVGARLGSLTHTHPLSAAGQALIDVDAGVISSKQVATPAYNNTNRVNGTTSATVTSRTSGVALTGTTEENNEIIPPHVVMRHLIKT